ncbi:hypothetical protein [Kordia jejudonensis]|uniref:hypothetical protein n=1 Tax=Kordia jejudonensis TaxID=1348245 RepID=UPI0006291A63|nr:hypothetical protein [Kordia jejudonensis]
MKKQKITKLSLRKNTVSSLEASNLSGGTGTYDCFTFAPPCVSFTEPPEDPTYICPGTGTTPPPGSNGCPTNQSCNYTCGPICDPGGGSNTCPPN